jgi:hypothetical protein
MITYACLYTRGGGRKKKVVLLFLPSLDKEGSEANTWSFRKTESAQADESGSRNFSAEKYP